MYNESLISFGSKVMANIKVLWTDRHMEYIKIWNMGYMYIPLNFLYGGIKIV